MKNRNVGLTPKLGKHEMLGKPQMLLNLQSLLVKPSVDAMKSGTHIVMKERKGKSRRLVIILRMLIKQH